MSRPQDPHRPSFPFGNPFKKILSKGSYLSPRLLAILNAFEESLAEKIKDLKPRDKEDVVSLSWLKHAMELLCAIHTDIKVLITELEFPVCDWDEKWIDVYLDNSLKLLDICIACSSELSRLGQSHLFVQCSLQYLDGDSKQFIKARSSLDEWRQHIKSKNKRLGNCFSILDNLIGTLNLPKVKNSAKGKVLMRAMYGVKVVTVFVCSIFAVAFSGSVEKLLDVQIPETFLWEKAFLDLQTFVNSEVRNIASSQRITALKELEAVHAIVNRLYPVVQDGMDTKEVESFQSSISEFGTKAETLSNGLDLLGKQVDGFFQIVLNGRDALLSSLRVGSDISNSTHVQTQVVR